MPQFLSPPWTASRRTWFCLSAIFLGLILRTGHYARNPSVWHDEAALIINVLDRSFEEMLGPLRLHEAAPPLFLALEAGVVHLLGDSTFALRLVPFAVSCLTLLLLWQVGCRLLDERALPWALLLVACSDRLIWHAVEAKPYALDVFLAVALAAVYLASQNLALPRRIALFVLLAPVVIWLSFPGCFLYGGVLVALLLPTWRVVCGYSARTLPGDAAPSEMSPWPARLALLSYLALVVIVGAAFFALATGPIRAQRCPEMTACWVHGFPDLNAPWRWPGWTLYAITQITDYVFRPIGAVLVVFLPIGIVRWVRRGQSEALLLLGMPFVLAWVASVLQAYPFTGARVMAFAAPLLALLAAEGVVATWDVLAAQAQSAIQCWATAGVLGVLLLAPLAYSLKIAAIQPWRRAEQDAAAELVLARHREGDVVACASWEGLYYYRCLGAALLCRLPRKHEADRRVWLVMATDNAKVIRDQVQKLLSQGRPLLESHLFVRCEVLLFGPVAESNVVGRRAELPCIASRGAHATPSRLGTTTRRRSISCSDSPR